MRISRRGASADFGESSIELNAPAFSWSAENSCFTIKQSRVRDFAKGSHHDYTVRLSLTDMEHFLKAISDAAASDPVTFEKSLEPSIKPLLRILAVATGLAPNTAAKERITIKPRSASRA